MKEINRDSSRFFPNEPDDPNIQAPSVIPQLRSEQETKLFPGYSILELLSPA
jgi:hypothetical protein